MTAFRDLKKIVRARQLKTGESYTTARAHVVRERDRLLGIDPDAPAAAAERVEAAVLKVDRSTARVRIAGEAGEVTFRSLDVWDVVPGHLVTLAIARRWTFGGAACASGRIENPRIDAAGLGLEPLPLTGGELLDPAEDYEPFVDPEPYAQHWRRLTGRPRPAFEFDGIAWAALPGMEPDADPVRDAIDRAEAGDRDGAWQMLMDLVSADLRCLDAHAHLGNLVFEHAPERAIVHYEVGVRIGELSLPAGFDGLLVWGQLYNRPFLRCLRGYGLCLWRLGRMAAAQRVFERLLALNPNDNQGVRFCWDEVRSGRSWEQMQELEAAEDARRRRLY